MRGQLTLDALTASLISALILLILTSVAGIIKSHGLFYLTSVHKSYSSVDRFVTTLLSPSWVGTNLTWQSFVNPGEPTIRWGPSWALAPLRSGYRMYLAVDAYKWVRCAGGLDRPIKVGNATADLVFPRDDVGAGQAGAPGEMIVKSYRVALVKRADTWVWDDNLPQVWASTSGDQGRIVLYYPATVPGVKVAWVTLSGAGLRWWVMYLHRRFNQLVESGLSEDEAYRKLAREALLIDSGGNKIMFYSSTGWVSEDPVDFIRKVISEGTCSGLSITVLAIGGDRFLVQLRLSRPAGVGLGEFQQLPGTLTWACGLFPVRLKVGVKPE